MKGANEKYLYEILNEMWPKQWVSELRAIPGRKFRFDCANPNKKVAVEIEGGIWMPKGAHNTGVAMSKDMEKYNLAQLAGWKVLRYSPETLRKEPWKIRRDVMTACGEPNQVISFDNVHTEVVSAKVPKAKMCSQQCMYGHPCQEYINQMACERFRIMRNDDKIQAANAEGQARITDAMQIQRKLGD